MGGTQTVPFAAVLLMLSMRYAITPIRRTQESLRLCSCSPQAKVPSTSLSQTHPPDSTASIRIRVIDGAFWEGRVQPNGSNALSKMFGSWVVMGCMRRGGRAGAGVQVHQLLTAAFGDSLTSRL